MHSIWQQQLDFILLIHGLSLVLLAAICWQLRRLGTSPGAWHGLIALCIAVGASRWIWLLPASTGNALPRPLEMTLWSMACICLPAGMLVAMRLWRGVGPSAERRWVRGLAIGVPAICILSAIDGTGHPFVALGAMLAAVAATIVAWELCCRWHACQTDATPNHSDRLLVVAVLGVAALGWAACELSGRHEDERLREGMLARARLAAAVIEADDIRALRWDESDARRPEYQRIRHRLRALQQSNADCRFISLLGFREGRSHVLADSEPEDSDDHSPPGELYPEISAEDLALLSAGRAGVTGPTSDRWGTWITALAPLAGNPSERVALAFDVTAEHWARAIALHRAPAALVTALLIVLLIAASLLWRQEREAAQITSRGKTDFLARMSHEIRTPINGIIGMAELLMRERPTTRQREQLQTLTDEADLLLRLINDVLDYAKIEAGRLTVERIALCPRRTVESICRTMGVRAGQKQLAFHCEIDEDVPEAVLGDPLRLQQVLMNLLGNAIKFTDAGGVAVNVSVAWRAGGTACVRFSVSDTGIGIPGEKQAGIFNPFQQADTSTARRYGGTGLGAAICRQLVELMDGRIGFESEAGKGSTFWFAIPFALADADAVHADTHEGLALSEADLLVSRPARILLVEDYPTNQQIALAHLRDGGHHVDLAENGEEAVRLALSRPYDLVLMDVELPGMDGLEATAAIREAERRGGSRTHVPIVGVTAHGIVEYMDRCLAAGMDMCVRKPLRRAHLLLIVAGIMEQAPAAADAAGERALDVARALEELGDDREALQRILRGFLEGIDEQVEMIRRALAAGDAEGVRRESHRIKGGAANLGADPLARLAGELEQAAKQQAMEAAPRLLMRMERAVADLRSSACDV